MNINKKLIFIMFFIILMLAFSGCYKPTENISVDNESDNISESINVFNYEDDDININWGYGCKLDGMVYTIYNNGLRYYENGKLKLICRDPLCEHSDLSCPSNNIICIELVATDGNKLYCSGYYPAENPKYQEDIEAGRTPDCEEYVMNDCIYEIDPQTQKLKIITQWESTGASRPLLRVNGDYIYYLIVTSETRSDLYRVNKNGGDGELVSKNNDGSITNVVFGEKFILYRKGNAYYKTDSVFGISEPFLDEILSFITFKGNFIYYAREEKKSYDCINSNKKVSLYSADIYKIKIEDINDITKAELVLEGISSYGGFIITDNRIVYFPNEPVYLGKISFDGNVMDSYNKSNGKIMTFDLNTFEKKTVCTDLVAGVSSFEIDYADANQVILDNIDKIFHLDINTGELTELEIEK